MSTDSCVPAVLHGHSASTAYPATFTLCVYMHSDDISLYIYTVYTACVCTLKHIDVCECNSIHTNYQLSADTFSRLPICTCCKIQINVPTYVSIE